MKAFKKLLCIFYISGALSAFGEQGIASIYTVQSNHGKTTASGVELTNTGNMVAHKQHPFGTKLLITNLKNQKSAIGIVVDRGPFIKGRIVDLTPGIASKLGLTKRQGITMVKVMVVGKMKLVK